MNFVGRRGESGSKQRERSVLEEAQTGKAHPESAQPCQGDQAVSREVASLTNIVVNQLPARAADGAEDVFPD